MGRLVKRKEFLLRMEELRAQIRSGTGAFGDGSDAGRAERVERARTDKLYFARTYFPHYCEQEFAPIHPQMYDADEVTEKPVVVAGARGFAKSVHISLINKIHKIVYRRRRFLGIGSRSVENAMEYTGAIKEELENNERLVADFGEQKTKGRRWQWHDFTTSTGIRVMAFGIRDSIKGKRNGPHRFDDITLEDVEDRMNTLTPRVIRRSLQRLMTDVKYALAPHAWTFIYVGNYFTKISIIHQLLTADKYGHWHRKIFPAWYVDDKGKLHSNWPARFPVKELQRMKAEDGTEIFDSEMLQRPHDEDRKFHEEWFRHHQLRYVLPKIERKVMSVDLSAKAKVTSDYKAVIVQGMMPGPQYPTLHAWIRRVSKWQCLRMIFQLQKEWHCDQVAIQVVAFEDTVREDIELLEREYGFRLPVKYVPVRDNKDVRIGRLTSHIERGVITFDLSARGGDQALLVDQYIGYPDDNDDGPDAQETAIDTLERAAGRSRVNVNLIEA